MVKSLQVSMQVFFIVGAQKSGTTWLQKSLNSIDGIHCLGEGHFIDKLLMPMAQNLHEYNKTLHIVQHRVYEGNGFYEPVPEQEFLQTMRSWILKMMGRNSKVPQDQILALGDKTPANSFHIPTLKRLFPKCRFIHLLRDGRDVAISTYRHRERIQAQAGQSRASLDASASQLLATWAGCTRAIRKAEMAGIPIHTVRYEAMLDNTEVTLRSCVDHLLPPNSISDQQIQAAVKVNRFQTLNGGREPGVIDNNSNLRRGQAGSWKDELSPAAIDKFNPEDRELLDKLGYTA